MGYVLTGNPAQPELYELGPRQEGGEAEFPSCSRSRRHGQSPKCGRGCRICGNLNKFTERPNLISP